MTGFAGKAFVVVAALGLIGTACSKSSSSTTAPPAAGGGYGGGGAVATTPASAQMLEIPAANNKGTKSVSGKSSFAVDANSTNGVNYYSPTVLDGTPGQKVTLELTNASTDVPHNFTLSEQNLNVDLKPGTTTKVTVTFPQSGTLQFHCEYHVGSGMIGELTAK